MKTVSIRQLHEATGRTLRRAAQGPLIVTNRTHPVVMIRHGAPRPHTPTFLRPEYAAFLKKMPMLPDSAIVLDEIREY